jgi:4-coumarate--CoA ligase
MLSPLHRGVTTYIMQGFNLPQFCKVIEQESITVAYIVPPVALALARAPVVDNFNLKSLRFMHSSAAPTPKEIIVAVRDRLDVPVRQGYGLSEAAPGVCSQRSTAWNNPIGASGRLVPNMLARFVTDNGKEVTPGDEGEICLKGPNIFKGYYNDAKATAEAVDAEGWYHTGDIGKADKQGNIYITDRLKDLIKYNGFQVAPAQLEDLLLGHAAVADVAVIGVYSDERATELPRAYVVVAAGYKGDEQLGKALQEWVNERVAPHKKLRGGVRFVDAIPKSNAGKVLRRVLAEQVKLEEEAKRKQAGVKARL